MAKNLKDFDPLYCWRNSVTEPMLNCLGLKLAFELDIWTANAWHFFRAIITLKQYTEHTLHRICTEQVDFLPFLNFIIFGILLRKLFWPTVRKKMFSENGCKFSVFSLKFAKLLRPLEQFIRTVNGQTFFYSRLQL